MSRMSDSPVRIVIKPAGPIHVHGPVILEDHEGNPLTPPVSKVAGVIKLCGSGLSANKPFCDGSHRGTGINPVEHVAQTTGTAYFCGCKHSRTKPLCDGAHRGL